MFLRVVEVGRIEPLKERWKEGEGMQEEQREE